MKPVLITGTNGQLGRKLFKLTSAAGNAADYIHTSRRELDITNSYEVEEFLAGSEIKCIVNCAAYTDVDMAEKQKDQAMLVNHAAVGHLVSAAEKNQAYIIHISTDYVFDGKSNIPYREDDLPRPLSVYGMTKLKGEEEVLKYNKGMVIRTSWLYSSEGRNFFTTMLRLGKERDEISVVFDQVGSPTFAGDLAKAVMRIIECVSGEPARFMPGIFHYANEGICSRYDQAVEIMKTANLNCRVVPVESEQYPLPARRPHYSVLNKSMIKRLYIPDIPHWRDSLIKCTDEVIT